MVESAGLVARAAGAEEEAQSASVATADWTIAPTPTPIPPDTTDAELVALWLHGKSPHTIRAYGDDVAAFRRFTGKPLRATVGSAALRGQPRRCAGDPRPPAPDPQVAAVVRDPDGLPAVQRRRGDSRASSRNWPRGSSASAKCSRCSRRSKIGRGTMP